MLFKQFLRWVQLRRHLTIVPDIYFIFVYTNLNRVAGTIILVNHRIQQYLTECILRKHKLLNPLNPIIINQCFQIFGINQINSFINLFNQRAMYLVLIFQIWIRVTKITNLDIRTCNPFLRIFIKRQHCGSYQIIFFIK